MSVIAVDPRKPTAQPCAKAQAAHRRGPVVSLDCKVCGSTCAKDRHSPSEDEHIGSIVMRVLLPASGCDIPSWSDRESPSRASARVRPSASRVRSQSLLATATGSMPASFHQAASLPTRCTNRDGCGRAGPRIRRSPCAPAPAAACSEEMRVGGFAAAEQARCWATPPHVQARAAVDLGNRENTKRATIRVGPSRWP